MPNVWLQKRRKQPKHAIRTRFTIINKRKNGEVFQPAKSHLCMCRLIFVTCNKQKILAKVKSVSDICPSSPWWKAELIGYKMAEVKH